MPPGDRLRVDKRAVDSRPWRVHMATDAGRAHSETLARAARRATLILTLLMQRRSTHSEEYTVHLSCMFRFIIPPPRPIIPLPAIMPAIAALIEPARAVQHRSSTQQPQKPRCSLRFIGMDDSIRFLIGSLLAINPALQAELFTRDHSRLVFRTYKTVAAACVVSETERRVSFNPEAGRRQLLTCHADDLRPSG